MTPDNLLFSQSRMPQSTLGQDGLVGGHFWGKRKGLLNLNVACNCFDTSYRVKGLYLLAVQNTLPNIYQAAR